jgi:hypothetical protein
MNVAIPNSMTTIKSYVFYKCDRLTSVTMPDSVTCIDNYAFERCTGLMSVAIPDSVTSIGKDAFYGCKELTSVTIGSNVASIGWRAFFDCSNLKSVVFKGKTLEEVANDTGISVSALSMYETGERIPRDRFKVILADYYKRSIKGIFYN